MVQSKIETFTAMLAEQPENAMIWYGLATEQYKLENWAEAAKSLRQVVSLNPDSRPCSDAASIFRPAQTHCAHCSKLNKNAAPIFSGSPTRSQRSTQKTVKKSDCLTRCFLQHQDNRHERHRD